MSDSAKSTNFLTTGQSKLLAFTLCAASVFLLFLLCGWIVRSLGIFMDHFSSVLWPLAISAILTVLLSPVVLSIERWLGWGRSFSILTLYLLVLVVGTFTIWGVGAEVLKQVRELTGSSMDWPERIENRVRQSVSPATWDAVAEKFGRFKQDWKQTLQAIGTGAPQLTKGSARALQDAWSGVSSFLSSLACLAIAPIYLFYFLSSRRDHLADLVGQLTFFKPDTRQDLVYLVHQFKEIIEAFFRGQLLIGAMMGVGYAIGFSLSGLKFGIALGLLFGILNVVPFLGSVLGCLTAVTVAYLQPGGILESGEWSVLWGCAITFSVVQLFESYWLSPKVMGDRTGLHPVVIIASVFFWGVAFGGVLGMILGIPLTAFLIVLWRLLRQKYLPI
ncbi:AI-2E family transporter [Opitutales bacterium]|nr:AI-2E family transporter [Opitutales bacterium]